MTTDIAEDRELAKRLFTEAGFLVFHGKTISGGSIDEAAKVIAACRHSMQGEVDRLTKERDALQFSWAGCAQQLEDACADLEQAEAKLASLAKMEPVGEVTGWHLSGSASLPTILWTGSHIPQVGDKLFAAAIPAQHSGSISEDRLDKGIMRDLCVSWLSRHNPELLVPAEPVAEAREPVFNDFSVEKHSLGREDYYRLVSDTYWTTVAEARAYLAGCRLPRSDYQKAMEYLSTRLHYPQCWDTAVYSTIESVLDEIGLDCNTEDCTIARQPSAAKASSACPICGIDTPHHHNDFDICRWIEAQGNRFAPGRFSIVKKEDYDNAVLTAIEASDGHRGNYLVAKPTGTPIAPGTRLFLHPARRIDSEEAIGSFGHCWKKTHQYYQCSQCGTVAGEPNGNLCSQPLDIPQPSAAKGDDAELLDWLEKSSLSEDECEVWAGWPEGSLREAIRKAIAAETDNQK